MGFSSPILAVVPAAVIGVAAGLFAIVFTVLNVKISRLRQELTSHLKWGRVIEPCVLAGIYITGCMLLPLFFPCTPTECTQGVVSTGGVCVLVCVRRLGRLGGPIDRGLQHRL